MGSTHDFGDKDQRMRSLPRWRKGLYLVLPFLLTFALLEGLFRLLGYAPFRPPPQSPSGYFHVSDQRLGHRNRPNGRYRYTMIEEAPLVTTDSLGYRTSTNAAPPDAPRIVFIGDSAVFGAEVDDAQTIPSEVAKALAPHGPVRVLNAGVRGYNTLQARRMLDDVLDRFPDVAVVVYLFSSNDYVETLNPIVHFPLQAPTLWYDRTTRTWQEVDIEAPAAPHGAPFTPPQRRLAWRTVQALKRHSALLNQVGLRVRTLIGTPALLQQKTRLPNGSLGPIDTGLPEWQEQWHWAQKNGADDALRVLLQQMQTRCRTAGAAFLTTAFTRGQEDPSYDVFAAAAAQAGVRFVDIKPYFTAEPTTYAALRQDGAFDPHYGPTGTRTFAGALLPALRTVLPE